ncbi:MAG: ribosomal protein S18-alanine N-acetyltransferase [Deltaproteobacteria bacterium]|nr:ribosomal protein S18-alanine N-acetyltransferase [Deltaproteobacteria bacterium]
MNRIVGVSRGNYEKYLEGIMDIENISFPSPWSRNAFIQELTNPVSHLWVVPIDQSVAGYICFWMFDSEIQLIDIAVHPEKRGQGFGYFLLSNMIETGVAKGIRSVWLEVRESNQPAKRLYQRFHFEDVGRRPRYYRDTNEDAIVMALRLSERDRYRKVSN